MLPEFTVHGASPPGIHATTFAEISMRYGRFQRTDQTLTLVGSPRTSSSVRSGGVAGYDGLFLEGLLLLQSEEPHDIFDVLLVFEQRRTVHHITAS